MITWHKLDPSKADSGAIHGARFNGCTLLELPSGTVAIVGLMSCASRESAERVAAETDMRNPRHRADFDRHITRKTFESWIIQP